MFLETALNLIHVWQSSHTTAESVRSEVRKAGLILGSNLKALLVKSKVALKRIMYQEELNNK